jgi:hypothetical protein
MIDANETIGDKPGGLAPIFNRVGLIDLIHHQHKVEDNVNTYARGWAPNVSITFWEHIK